MCVRVYIYTHMWIYIYIYIVIYVYLYLQYVDIYRSCCQLCAATCSRHKKSGALSVPTRTSSLKWELMLALVAPC